MDYHYNLSTTKLYKIVILIIVGITLGQDPVLIGAQGDNEESGNLLSNAGFEHGDGFGPYDWTTSPPGSSAIYTWDNTYSNSGDYSVRIDIENSDMGVCQQIVGVAAETVYVFTGHVAFEEIISPGRCNLQVVFRNAGSQIVQSVDLSPHDGARPFELDFPYNLKVRAPEGAAFAEINCLLQGPGTAWFDDLFFGVAPAGSIAGTVTSGGVPLPNTRVWISGDPWNKVCQAYTDELGRYTIEDVPVAFPRYILMAEKGGYKSQPAGDIKIIANQTVTVDFELTAGVNPIDNLRVKYGTLDLNYYKTPYQVPSNAVIPQDASGYPIEIQPFLVSDQYITSDDPEIVALAQQILDSLAPEDKTNTGEVAWAVYEWIAKAINHDAVFTYAVHDDVTTGIYQTIRGGWCWGHNFYDWAYKPTETLEYKCAICVEHSWLTSAVLRALNIPARAQIGSAQFWVQKPGEYGYWISNLSTSGGSNSYREHGIIESGFGGGDIPAFLPVTSEPFLQEDFGTQNKCLWREKHPWTANYSGTEQGLNQALNDMNIFEQTGNAPSGQGGTPGSDRYIIRYSDTTVNLYNIGTQRILDTRFPMISESESHHDMQRLAFWTNHPECVTRTWIEEITNPPAVGVQRWFHIEFDLTNLVGPLDFNNDGICNLVDFATFTQYWYQIGSSVPADLDGNHTVNIADLSIFAEHWLWPE